ncbi:putative acylesterase/phospholipase RssA [Neobacillus niacini]|uniref:patatin-like phospholipase family protein n=1 Tax=Neobacillus niacini TaxID=86668 RepID=UPI00285C6314|nr:patatin-like phospholipase family protein [Neobacillus niacini]MDR7078765.1 putative acylesterase/phospholipase RssA [Neobacillus niacini]
MTVGIVFSGGGARGDFQVGAVRYLYEIKKIRPAILAGCSVGSINAIMLAEGKGDPTGLIKLWRDMQNNSDMWREEDWLANIQNTKLAAFFKKSSLEQSLQLHNGFRGNIKDILELLEAVGNIGYVIDELGKVVKGSSRSLYNLGPINTKLSDPSKLDLEKVQKSGIKLRLATVALESGALRFVTETGEMLERDNTTPVQAPLAALSPQCQSIAAKIEELKNEADNFQALLHESVNGKPAIVKRMRELNSEITRLTSELNNCKVTYPPKPSPLRVSLIQGTLASASIPLAFPPVKLGNENYVDGGVREIVPIQVAIQSGATDVYAILASDSKVDSARSVATGKLLSSFNVGAANILDVASRAANDIMTDETVLNEIDPPRGWGVNVTIIQPNFDIHDIMTIDPGLIDIRMAHGYMRADDTLQAKQRNPMEYQQLTEEYAYQRRTSLIVQTRLSIWVREYAANGFLLKYDDSGRPVHPAPTMKPDLQALLEVRSLKNTLKDIVQERKQAGGLVPSEAESWWLDWERHPWKPIHGLWLQSGPAAEGNDMLAGEVLAIDRPIHSANGLFTFVFQSDGNLVLYKNTKVTGALAPQCKLIDNKIQELQMEKKDLQNELGGIKGPALAVIIRKLDTQISQANTELRACNIANPPQTINGKPEAIWSSRTGGPGGVCIMQGDGNLVIYDAANKAIWSSDTWTHPGSRLVVQDDGIVVIIRPDGRRVWATKS